MSEPTRSAVAVTRVGRLGVAVAMTVGLVVPMLAPTPARAQDPAPTTTPAPTRSVTATAEPMPEPVPLGPFEVFSRLHAESLAAEQVGFVVMDADGAIVAEHESHQPLLPASTMKVLSAAAVLDTMGPHRRLTTRVRSPQPPDAKGIVQSLVLVGAGDPTLTSQAYRTHIYPSRPATSIEVLADRIVAAGVTRVTGDVVGDGTAFGPLDVAAGWPPHYLSDFDARHLSGLTINAGIEVDTALIDGSERLIGQHLAVHPELLAAWELAHALEERGVVVDGSATMATVPSTARHQVAWVASPALHDILAFMLEESDNHLADTLVRTSGLRAEGAGTWSAGARAVEAAVVDLGADPTGLVVDDGSGLSRLDRVAPITLAQVDRGLYERFGPSWSDWLSTAGVDGTFENRLVGTNADGTFHGKSGTLDDVKSRVGHVVAGDGSHLHMAVMGNGLSAGDRWRVIVMADDLILTMLDHLEGCRHVPRDVEPAPVAATSAPGTPASPTPVATPAEVELPTVPLSDSSAWTRVCAAR